MGADGGVALAYIEGDAENFHKIIALLKPFGLLGSGQSNVGEDANAEWLRNNPQPPNVFVTPYGTDCEGGLVELDDIVECMVEAQRLGLETIDDLVLDVRTLPAHLLNDSYEPLFVLRQRMQTTLDFDDYLRGRPDLGIQFTPQLRAMTIREWLQTVRTNVGPVHMYETWT